MTLVLKVDRRAWDAHVTAVAGAVEHLVPVVKGNGYGFGRAWLAARAAELAPHLAVGTVHEVNEVPADRTPIVLTPLPRPVEGLRPDAVVTVGADEHIAAARGRRAIVKVRSSMNRYGVDVGVTHLLVERARAAGADVIGLSVHPPLHGSNDDHVDEVGGLVRALDSGLDDLDLWISHVDPRGIERLSENFPSHRWHLRLGTGLWHGDKSMLRLDADVIATRTVRRGEHVGYRGVAAESDGTLVMIGCGTAHGVTPHADGSSPFHFARKRLPLVEPPHMHTSMVVVERGDPVPAIGDSIDVQRPLIATTVDRVDWH